MAAVLSRQAGLATLVTAASQDEFLAMHLICDRVPGTGERYVLYSMVQLVEALEKYSQLRQTGEDDPGVQLVKTSPPPSNIPPGAGR